MSEEEYVTWSAGDKGTEWVDGKVIVKMSVEEAHDVLQAAIRSAAEDLVTQRGAGQVRGPEFAMRLELKDRVVRRNPDVLFVAAAHSDRLTRSALRGACDLAVEIVSEESRNRDYRDKYAEYEEAGVREYWIIDPRYETIDLYRLNATLGKYEQIDAGADGALRSLILDGFWLRSKSVFVEPLPRARQFMTWWGLLA